MKRNKKPTSTKKDAPYPSLRESKCDRRRFLALLGGGVAGSTLFSACYESGVGGSPIDSVTGTGADSTTDMGTDSATDTGTDMGTDAATDTGTIDTISDSETVDTGWDTNEPIGGDPPEPEFFQRRLPGTGFQILRLENFEVVPEVVYAVTTVFEERLFLEMSAAELLKGIDEKLRTNHPNIGDFETQDGVERVETTVREALTQACLAEQGVDPSFVEVTFVVERVRYDEPLAGDGGGDPNWPDTDSGNRW